MQAPKAPQEHILGRPASDATQFEQALSDHCIALSEILQVQVPSTDRSGEVKERANLLTAEPDRSIILRSQLHDVVRGWERKASVRSRPASRTADRREPIEQLEADLQRQLLACERIDDGFEIVGNRGGFMPRNLLASSRSR